MESDTLTEREMDRIRIGQFHPLGEMWMWLQIVAAQ
jgi:hypothetical protein